jgi:putative alpha-1,2-mannosidase
MGSVSTTQEYNITDFAISQLAKSLNRKEDELFYSKRSISYRSLFDKEFGLLRPKNEDDSWVSPFNPETGANWKRI